MERLSYKDKDRIDVICKYEDCDICEQRCPCINEDNCLCLQEILERLAKYEDLEEQNRLLKLPYAINDTVYYLDDITPFEEMPIEGRISGFRVTWCRTIVIHITTNFNDEGCLADRNEDIDVVAEEFGKTVFLTREEAEAALKELEGRNKTG